MNGWKVFDKDLKCRGFQYETGKTYRHEGNIGLCEAGFHFSENLSDCFSYRSFNPKNRVCKIIALGNTIKGNGKSVTSEITILKEISWEECLRLVNIGKGNSGYRNSGYRNSGDRNSGDRNSGDWNSGYRNSGDRNSGYRNSGDWNSGDWNSGYRNSGDRNSGDRNSGSWNSGDWNSGYLNSGTPKIRIFDRETDKENIQFPDFFYHDLTVWINKKSMTDEEKKNNPSHETTGGYLKILSFKDAWRAAWKKASIEDRKKCLSLPNWDNIKFFNISGIDVEEELLKEKA
jgi:hypothetical protein